MPQKLPNNLIIAFRYPSDTGSPQELELYLNYLKSFKPKKIICATSEGCVDTPLLQKEGVEVFEYSDYKNEYYIKPILDFYKYANDHHLLILSFGVELEGWQLDHGFDLLRSRNLLCVGWRILQQENDGSYLGRLAYNTCMLHEPEFYTKVLSAGGIPDYVANGALGSVSIKLSETTSELRIGGQEDLAVQLRLYKYFHGKKHKLFGHITHYGLEYLLHRSDPTKLTEKLLRKVITAETYRKVENVNAKDFLDSWVII